MRIGLILLLSQQSNFNDNSQQQQSTSSGDFRREKGYPDVQGKQNPRNKHTY
jgi:hypothetical protein